MTRDEVQIGVILKVIAPRWDRQPGTLARVTETGYHFIDRQWWFTVEWLIYLGKRSPHSLRMGEEELQTFEVATGVATLPAGRAKSRLAPPPPLSQGSLPFTANDDDDD